MGYRVEDFGFEVVPVALGGTFAVAGSGADGAEYAGVWATRSKGIRSGAIIVSGTANLDDGESLSFSGIAMDHANDSGGADAVEFLTAADVVINAPAGGGTVAYVFKVSVKLTGAREYFRVRVTPTFSRANTDSGVIVPVLAGGGAELL